MPSNMNPEQRARWDAIKAKVADKNIKLIEAETATAIAEQTLVQTIQDVQNGLVSIPKPGEEWDVAKNYIEGNTATDGGVLYVARRYSRGKRPSEQPDYWMVKVETVTYPAWADIADGTVIPEGDRVTHDGFVWECVSQNFKSTVNKPKDGSSKWVKIGPV